jgi:peptide/nickel transport system ATP-binding protein
LDLLRDLRDRRGMGMMFITHDLGLVAEIADQVAVMYEGNIVEFGPVEQIFGNPQHPYTQGLLTCRPQPDRRLKKLPTVADFMEVVTLDSGERQIKTRGLDMQQVLQAKQEVSAAEQLDGSPYSAPGPGASTLGAKSPGQLSGQGHVWSSPAPRPSRQ